MGLRTHLIENRDYTHKEVVDYVKHESVYLSLRTCIPGMCLAGMAGFLYSLSPARWWSSNIIEFFGSFSTTCDTKEYTIWCAASGLLVGLFSGMNNIIELIGVNRDLSCSGVELVNF